ncbi:hypothetical protein Lal_00016937 [Lupinus albus]|nr:hypothetical protein Lal_00016937 [Lupinus albus]
MLLRNLDQSEGSCNGTRLVVTKMTNHVGKKHWKYHIYYSIVNVSIIVFMTFHVYQKTIPYNCFLYIVISRVQTKNGLNILIHDKDGKSLKSTTNVVYKGVFQNL